MRAQSQMFIILALLALTASAKQTHFLSTSAEEAIASTETLSASTTYTATVYYGDDVDEECLLSDGDINDATGLLFNQWGLENLCISYSSGNDNLYLVGQYSSGKETKLVKMGAFDYSYRVKYITEDEEIYVQRTSSGDDASSGFTLSAQSSFEAYTLTAYLTAEEDYEEVISSSSDYTFYPYETKWADIYDDDYEISVKVSQGAERCFIAKDGYLSDTKVCVDYDDDGTVTVTAANTFINQSEPLEDVDRILVTYTNFDSFIIVADDTTNSKDELFYIPSIDVRYILEEGEIDGGREGTISLFVDNTMEYPYDCLTFKTDLLDNSVIAPSIEAMCVYCERQTTDRYDCEINLMLESDGDWYTYHNLTLDGEIFMMEEGIQIDYDLSTDQFTFDFWHNDKNYDGDHDDRYRYTKYADELVEYAHQAGDYPELSINRPYLLHNRIAYGYDLLNTFDTMAGIQFTAEFHQNYGLLCNEFRCLLGFINETNFEAVNSYEGQFTDWIVTSFITEDDGTEDPNKDPQDFELVCLTLTNYFKDYAINDCKNKDQWQMYQATIYQYPIYDGSISGAALSPPDSSV